MNLFDKCDVCGCWFIPSPDSFIRVEPYEGEGKPVVEPDWDKPDSEVEYISVCQYCEEDHVFEWDEEKEEGEDWKE